MAPRKINLSNLGDLEAIAEREFGRICDNIADPNIKTEAKREMTIKVIVKPDKKGQTASISYQVTTKLPGVEPGTSTAYIAMQPGSVGKLALFSMDLRQGELPLGTAPEQLVTEIRTVSDAPKSVPSPQPVYAPTGQN